MPRNSKCHFHLSDVDHGETGFYERRHRGDEKDDGREGRMSNYVDLSERVTATYYDEEHEEWTQKTVTVADILDSVCDDYTVLPSIAHAKKVTPHRNYKYLSDYWCECGWHLGKKGDVKYCSECGRKVRWDG